MWAKPDSLSQSARIPALLAPNSIAIGALTTGATLICYFTTPVSWLSEVRFVKAEHKSQCGFCKMPHPAVAGPPIFSISDCLISVQVCMVMHIYLCLVVPARAQVAKVDVCAMKHPVSHTLFGQVNTRTAGQRKSSSTPRSEIVTTFAK